MKNSIKSGICKFGLTVFLVMLSIAGKAQVVTGGQYSLSIGVATAMTNTIDVPLVVSVANPSGGMRFTGFQTSINFNPAIINGGTVTGTFVPSNEVVFNTVGTVTFNGTGNVRITLTSLSTTGASGVNLAQGAILNIGKIRLSNTSSWATGDASLWLQNVNANPPLRTQSIVQGVPFGITNGSAQSYTTTSPASPPGLILSHTQAAPLSLQVGQICATSGSAVVTNPSCFGGTGSASVTLSPTPVPALSSVSYKVDGGSTQTASLSGVSFTVPGLSNGAHSIVVSVAGCAAVTVSATVNAPAQLTNSTSITACNNYTWSVTGSNYTSSGTYTGTTTNGNGCTVNETLNLIINHSTSSSQSATACDSYTWSVNGTTYNASGTYTVTGLNTAGCTDTKTLVLTINNSTSSSQSATACDSYTWSANGTTYNASGTYTVTGLNTAGCTDTKTLVLTINHSTSSTQSATACDSYTWSANGTTYNTSGTYTATGLNAAGCTDTKTLVLTINNSTSSSQSVTACDTYTWSDRKSVV